MRASLLLRPAPSPAYDESKAAQIAAFFALRSGGTIKVLSLAKLMYLAERESYARYGMPLTCDALCSMEHGLVLSETLNHIRGEPGTPDIWRSYFAQRDGNNLSLNNRDLSDESLMRLSDANIDLLNAVWAKFGHMTPAQLRRYTHKLPEYEETTSSIPVKMRVLLSKLGYEEQQAGDIIKRVEEKNNFNAALKRAAV